MKKYKVVLAPRAIEEAQTAIDYYNSQQKGLGKRFLTEFKNTVAQIKRSPFYQVRYDDVRCLLIRNFSYMIHFSVDEQDHKVYVHAIIHTSLDPENSWVVKNT
jgi:hypothetical protein